MLIIICGALLSAACGVLWSIQLTGSLVRRGTRWIGHETQAELEELFVFVSSRSILGYSIVALLLSAVAGVWLRMPLPLLVVSCAFCMVGPRVVVWVLRRRRQQRLVTQLPDAMQLWASLLRSGLGLMPALSQLASRQRQPLGSELRLVLGECRLGLPLDRAMNSLRVRLGTNELRMLGTLLHAHRELGGNLAEALERLAITLRSRLAMEARIRSLTAQGRLQGAVVGLLPLVLAVVLYFMEPAAMHALFSTSRGAVCIAIILTLEGLGFLLIRRIVRIDI
jgi:tight adherence protein B